VANFALEKLSLSVLVEESSSSQRMIRRRFLCPFPTTFGILAGKSQKEVMKNYIQQQNLQSFSSNRWKSKKIHKGLHICSSILFGVGQSPSASKFGPSFFTRFSASTSQYVAPEIETCWVGANRSVAV
jgi:hypothetical protein